MAYMNPEQYKREYERSLRADIGASGMKRRLFLRVLAVLLFLVNYLASLSGAYNIFYPMSNFVLPIFQGWSSVSSVSLQLEGISHDLSTSYLFFSVLNVAFVLVFLFLGVVCTNAVKVRFDFLRFGKTHVALLFLPLFLLMPVLFFNEVGNEGRILINSKLKYGKIYFIRDTFFYVGAAMAALEFGILTALRIRSDGTYAAH